jgi:hypothetical protein
LVYPLRHRISRRNPQIETDELGDAFNGGILFSRTLKVNRSAS